MRRLGIIILLLWGFSYSNNGYKATSGPWPTKERCEFYRQVYLRVQGATIGPCLRWAQESIQPTAYQ